MLKRSLKGGAEEGDNMDESLQEEIQRTHDLVKKLQARYRQKVEWSKKLQKSLKLNNTTEIKRLVNVEEKFIPRFKTGKELRIKLNKQENSTEES